jgi:hypothetical protein
MMALMLHRLAIGPLLLLGCAPPPARPIVFPHEAAFIGGVCSTPPAGGAISVTVEDRLYPNGVRRFRLTNGGGEPHDVRPEFVVMNTGPCGAGYVRSSKLPVEDPDTCRPPDVARLDSRASLEIRTAPQQVRVEGTCEAIGLAMWADVDGRLDCFELGSWIAERRDEE